MGGAGSDSDGDEYGVDSDSGLNSSVHMNMSMALGLGMNLDMAGGLDVKEGGVLATQGQEICDRFTDYCSAVIYDAKYLLRLPKVHLKLVAISM